MKIENDEHGTVLRDFPSEGIITGIDYGNGDEGAVSVVKKMEDGTIYLDAERIGEDIHAAMEALIQRMREHGITIDMTKLPAWSQPMPKPLRLSDAFSEGVKQGRISTFAAYSGSGFPYYPKTSMWYQMMKAQIERGEEIHITNEMSYEDYSMRVLDSLKSFEPMPNAEAPEVDLYQNRAARRKAAKKARAQEKQAKRREKEREAREAQTNRLAEHSYWDIEARTLVHPDTYRKLVDQMFRESMIVGSSTGRIRCNDTDWITYPMPID